MQTQTKLPSCIVLSNGRWQSSSQERMHCFIWPHQKRAVSGLKMKTTNPAFTVESRRMVRKKRLEENSEYYQILCQCRSNILGKAAISQSYCSCTKNEDKYFSYWMLLTELHSYNNWPMSSEYACRYIHELTNTSECLMDTLHWCFKNDWGNKLPVPLLLPV